MNVLLISFCTRSVRTKGPAFSSAMGPKNTQDKWTLSMSSRSRPNISIEDPVQELKFDKLIGNVETPSYVILVQVINSIVLLQYYGWQRYLKRNSSVQPKQHALPSMRETFLFDHRPIPCQTSCIGASVHTTIICVAIGLEKNVIFAVAKESPHVLKRPSGHLIKCLLHCGFHKITWYTI